MNVNGRKTKETMIGPILKDLPPLLLFNGATVERVQTFKLLGVHVSMTSSERSTLTLLHPK